MWSERRTHSHNTAVRSHADDYVELQPGDARLDPVADIDAALVGDAEHSADEIVGVLWEAVVVISVPTTAAAAAAAVDADEECALKQAEHALVRRLSQRLQTRERGLPVELLDEILLARGHREGLPDGRGALSRERVQLEMWAAESDDDERADGEGTARLTLEADAERRRVVVWRARQAARHARADGLGVDDGGDLLDSAERVGEHEVRCLRRLVVCRRNK